MNKIFIISGPSGVGKTTVAKRVLKIMPQLKTTVTFSTRTERLGKKEDKTIIHISQEEFRKKIEQGDFIEWAMVHENLYGTDRKTLEETLATHNILMNIDVQGAMQIKKKLSNQTALIFLKAKSVRELTARIIKRENMSKEILQLRLSGAKDELSQAKKYDYVVENEHGKVRETVNRVVEIIQKEII